MPDIEHVDIPGGEIHEPKDIETAGPNEVYVSTGGGTGNWQQVQSLVLNPYDVPYGIVEVQNPVGSALLVTEFVTASFSSTGNSNQFKSPNLMGQFLGFEDSGDNRGVTFENDSLKVPETGRYRIKLTGYALTSENGSPLSWLSFAVNGTPITDTSAIYKANKDESDPLLWTSYERVTLDRDFNLNEDDEVSIFVGAYLAGGPSGSTATLTELVWTIEKIGEF